ncbi:MAG: pyroglutamyl-peptidase I [Alphaproteobacteria bacterium]|nr:pyroglutamyl-peptidase I [Alphaproteobacteria bacterium]
MLLTGFEAYGGHAVNPSGEVARALDGAGIAGVRVAGRVLPVVHAGLAGRIAALIDAVSPRAVICLGLDPGESAVRLERTAANALDFEIADNEGAILRGPVVAGGAAALPGTLPVPAIEDRLRAAGIPVRGSDDAGRYVCNALMYHALMAAARRDPAPACGFIHLPLLPEQADGSPSLPLERMVEAIRLAIETTLAAA